MAKIMTACKKVEGGWVKFIISTQKIMTNLSEERGSRVLGIFLEALASLGQGMSLSQSVSHPVTDA